MNKTVEKKEWEFVLFIMNKYNRTDGYVDYVENSQGNEILTFFDSNPNLKGVKAMYVTKEIVENIINSY